jgi:uncharacterized repeat protein (TIGR01451 family)
MKRKTLDHVLASLAAFCVVGVIASLADAQIVLRSGDAARPTGDQVAHPRPDAYTAPMPLLPAPELLDRADKMISAMKSERRDRDGLRRVTFDNPKSNASQGFAKRAGFTVQQGQPLNVADVGVFPVPLGREARQNNPHYRHNAANMPRSDEYVYDGSDREKRVQVDGDWNLYGLDTEDTFGHFDTLDGKRLVSPSNRVAIYAPRFSAVRRVDNLHKSERTAKVNQFKKQEGSVLSRSSDFSSTTKQHVAIKTDQQSQHAFGFTDQTRGVVSDNVLTLRKASKSFRPYENLDLIRWGRYSKSQTARLQTGMLAAKSWADNLGLQVHSDKVQPVVVNDALTLQQMVVVETDDDNAILRVVKVASKVAARPGEEVEFTIRFDNLSPRKIGNVTLIDNLTTRLRYVPNSAQCSLKGKFVQRENEGGSLMLRWEIDQPLPAGKGGVIRFKCLVK